METVLDAAGADTDAFRCVAPAIEKLAAGDQNIPGFPRLVEIYGEKGAKKIGKWLHYKDIREARMTLAVTQSEAPGQYLSYTQNSEIPVG